MEIVTIWENIASKQFAMLPSQFQTHVRNTLSAFPESLVTTKLISDFREIELGYREPEVRPDAHCACIGALLSLVCSIEGLHAHYRYGVFEMVKGKKPAHEYVARAMLLKYQFDVVLAIAKLLSSLNEVAIRILARSLIEASEYLLVVPRDPELSKRYAEDKLQFQRLWANKLKPAKIRGRRSKAVRSCTVFGKGAADDLNEYFEKGYRFLSMATHPSGLATMASLFSSVPESELLTKNMKTVYLLRTSVQYTYFPLIAAVVSDVEYQCTQMDAQSQPIIPGVLKSYQAEIVSIFKSFAPIIESGAPITSGET